MNKYLNMIMQFSGTDQSEQAEQMRTDIRAAVSKFIGDDTPISETDIIFFMAMSFSAAGINQEQSENAIIKLAEIIKTQRETGN